MHPPQGPGQEPIPYQQLPIPTHQLPPIHKAPYSALVLNKDYIYNKCKAHVNYAESPDGWSSHWGGVRLHPDRHMDKSFDPDKGKPHTTGSMSSDSKPT